MAKPPVTVVKDDKSTSSKNDKSKTVSTDLSSSLLEEEVEAALKSNDAVAMSKVQLKLLLSIATNLNKIDWKLWEFYNRLGK